MRRIALLPLLVAAAVPGAAHAGGWATVEVEGRPDGLAAGQPWQAELVVKQHGITPLDGIRPSVRIANDAGVTRTFPARPAGRPGTYVAEVVYPSAGTWRTRILDGFTNAYPHRLPPVTVAPSRATAGGPPWPQIGAIAFVALLFAAGVAATTFHRDGTRGRRRTAPRAVAG